MLTGLVAGLLGAAVLAWPSRAPVGRRLTAGASRPDRGLGRPRPVGALGPGSGPTPSRRLDPDLVMELVACGLRSGLSVTDALAASSGAAHSAYLVGVVGRLRLGVPPERAWAAPPPEYAGLARALILADVSGAPAAAVVRRAAADHRATRREQAELAAARLGVRLVLPLGLAVLPGFVLLAVVPIVLGLAEAVLQSG